MRPAARTPEELDTLFEDAFVIRDAVALAHLFQEAAVLVVLDDLREARGSEEIARLATALWEGDRTYVGGPQRIVQARDIALVLADQGIHVVRRGGDGAWRFAISLLAPDAKEER